MHSCGIIVTTDGWVQCPICKRNKRLIKVLPQTMARCLQVYCRECKSEIILDIEGESVKRHGQ